MRLSKLHISGFKSFAERAELGFDHGVTAIVGPNGCGKSNVVDAITWVLGEQSAKSLRGERMEDVIFGGSEGRKPTAAAEVRLAFTQVRKAMPVSTDAEERDGDPLLDEQPVITRDVEIGRRLYRSGESEYLIDGEVCRLRDIHDLLMDSGLGVKAYAVIEQGKIGQILSSRPAERRMLIEEAAGVTKYKARRRAAELKLEAAQQNLTRVDDVIYEVEKQRNALKRQAARARRYRTLREELRTWEQVQTARRYDALREAIAQADARLESARSREVLAAAHIAELENAIEAVRLGLTSAEARAASARDEAHGREMAIGRRQQQIQFDEQQIVELTRQAEAFALEADGLEARRAPLQEVLASQRQAAAHARETLATAQATVDAREAAYREAFSVVQSIEQAADQERAAVMAAATTLSALAQARDHAAAVRDRVAAERERLEIEARELGAEVERARGDVEAAEAALADARSASEATASARESAEAEVASLEAERTRLAQERSARERELAGREARLRSLEELETRRATFGDAARLLLSGEAGAFRHHGAVADHLTVERSYEKATEALLGDLLQYVIVDTTADAAAGLALVAEREAGRCGFVVLDALRDAAPAHRPVSVPAGARALSDVVSVSGPHSDALERLLDEAWVVDSLAAAETAAREGLPRVAALTGEVCGGRGPWTIEGGAHQGAHGILEIRGEIQQLRQESEEIAGFVEGLSAELVDVDQRLAAGRSRIAGLIADLHTREKEIVGLETRLAHARNERDRVAKRLEVIATERARAIEEQRATEQRREESIAAIAAHEARKLSAEQSLGEVLSRLQQGREAAEASMQQVAAARAEQSSLADRVASLEAEVARLERDAVELDERLGVRRADVDRLTSRVAELREAIATNRTALDDDVQALDGLKAVVIECDTQVSELRREFDVRDGEVRVARQALDAVRAEVMQAEVARTAAAGDLSHLAATCTENFGLGLDDVARLVQEWTAEGRLVPPQVRASAAAGDDEADEEDGSAGEAGQTAASASESEGAGEQAASSAQQAAEADQAPAPASEIDVDAVIALLRGRIDRLGPVNMMAIEQFDELEERHAFLTTQRQDLLDSISQTGEAIRKIDKTTRERFSEAFASINQHFESTFTTLFGGGRAGLVLIDQENEQESGIDIIAQPPGKRLQNVQLLSGGEKALTAMALMFAIFKHRPSPFCLLDEIDAPLDDANIGRFVEMLQGMQEHTQFILITHNRKTMEIADRLYGVTMEEPGVSKLISVQLN